MPSKIVRSPKRTAIVKKLATTGKRAESQVPIAIFLRRPFVMISLYYFHFCTATYLSQAMTVKWCKVVEKRKGPKSIFTPYNIQVYSNETWLNVKKSILAHVGITTAPTRRSVTAMLDNIMLEGFWSSLLCFIARIMNAFKRTVGNEATTAMNPIIRLKIEPSFSHDTYGAYGQKNVELDELMFVSLLFMPIL